MSWEAIYDHTYFVNKIHEPLIISWSIFNIFFAQEKGGKAGDGGDFHKILSTLKRRTFATENVPDKQRAVVLHRSVQGLGETWPQALVALKNAA